MSSNEKKATTITWAKKFATKTQTGMFKNRFLDRNKKPLATYVLAFFFIALICHISIRNSQKAFEQAFFEKGIQAANTMGEKISSPLLENDVLTLNVAIGELDKKNHPVFAAILDHGEKIIAHSDPNVIGKPFVFPDKPEPMEEADGISIDRASYKGAPIVSFTKEVFFSKIKIGKIIFGMDAQLLDGPMKKYGTWILGVWAACIIGLGLAVLLTDRYLKKRKARELEEFKKAETVGPYRLTRKIAQGGMAELFLAEYARHDGFKRTVAIKKILPHLVENQDFVDMFIREARLAALLQHPNIVQIFDLIKLHNANFIAMEFVDGKNLAEIMAHEKKGLPVGLATFLIQKISSGLYYSHTQKNADTGEPLNIVHRDVSPQNMLISFKGEVKISDFGISKARSEPSLTQAGVVKGKLSYLSPEQALGKETDHQADLYALGIIFYEILSGKRLYKFNNELEALTNLPKMEIPPIIKVREDIPDELNTIVMKCLEKDKAKRYQSGKEINDELAGFRRRLNISYDESNLVDFMAKRFK
ncbi:serine/threonine protein kinase [Desulfospira joergensenii]|uniref:serine/threonine protein kinase n=1 Tax=Desulfospira joergensenii TaxID=53329 RepID=UPI0003B52FD0|nr:serine/threonine-protein kinase [Desulfospira joergensenii]